MFKRILLFGIMNVAIIATVSIIMAIFGVQPYLTQNGLDYNSLMIFCLIWGSVGSFVSLQLSRWQAKKFMGVELVEGNPSYSKLVNTVHRLARSANLPKMPEVGVYTSQEVNAFATGPSKSRSLVAVSTGLLETMTDEEAEGVLAHEVSHISNGDMVTMALVQGVVNAFVMFFARVAAFAIQNALRSDDDKESSNGGWAYYLTTIVFEILFGFIGMFVIAFFSRYREFRADSGAAHLAGSSKMIAALRRLQSQYEAGRFEEKTDPKVAAFKISSPKTIMGLLSTHPPLEDRIKALQRRS